jgi:DNA-binding GntR family transcriptional regulator
LVGIDQGSPVALNAQVKADLLQRVRSGSYPVGAKIPSLRSLAAEYGVAELTVHAAVKELQHEGVLESSSGRGTFVRALPSDEGRADLAATVAELKTEVADLRSRLDAVEEAQRRG